MILACREGGTSESSVMVVPSRYSDSRISFRVHGSEADVYPVIKMLPSRQLFTSEA